jgi:hypothetical protein
MVKLCQSCETGAKLLSTKEKARNTAEIMKKMKTLFTVTLFIVGALLYMTPAFSDSFYRRSFAALTSRPGVGFATLYRDFNAQMDYHWQFVCWLTGSLMIGAAFLEPVLNFCQTKC